MLLHGSIIHLHPRTAAWHALPAAPSHLSPCAWPPVATINGHTAVYRSIPAGALASSCKRYTGRSRDRHGLDRSRPAADAVGTPPRRRQARHVQAATHGLVAEPGLVREELPGLAHGLPGHIKPWLGQLLSEAMWC